MKRFTEKDAAYIMTQLLSAVAYCHDRMVIHRDIKPENILLEEKGSKFNIKIGDFGSSCFVDPNKRIHGCFGSAYYVAPEVIIGEYNEKCDIWSCGVIMYVLLTGKPPYHGNNEMVILQMVRDCPLQITQLPNLSDSSVDLLKSLLNINIKRKCSAKEALNHPWIKNYRSMSSPPHLAYSLVSLKEFNASTKLKDAVHVYLATHVMSHHDMKTLKDCFRALDTNADGILSKNELLEGYLKTMNASEANAAVNKILNEVDTNNSGNIDFSEFLSACMNYNKSLSMDNLKAAFRSFDKDGSGFITLDELRNVLAGCENEAWESVMKEVDENGDGVIDLKEFVDLMTRHL